MSDDRKARQMEKTLTENICNQALQKSEATHHHEELPKYKAEQQDVLETDREILGAERRAFGHFHETDIHGLPECDSCCESRYGKSEEDCDYCGRDLASCRCDFLGDAYRLGVYRVRRLDCTSCAAVMEGKIRELPAVFFASLSFRKKELRVISRIPLEALMPTLVRICHSVVKDAELVPAGNDAESFRTETYLIPTLDCAACTVKLEKLINRHPEVLSASISYATKQMKLTAKNPDGLLPDLILLCREAEPGTNIYKQKKGDLQEEKGREWRSRREKQTLILGGIAFSVGMAAEGMTSWAGVRMPSFLWEAVFLSAYVILGGSILLKAARNIRQGDFFDENILMSVATLGALALQDYPEAAGVMFFYRVGEYWQDKAAGESRRQIMNAADLRPETAIRLCGDASENIAAEEVRVGDILLIRAGDRIPVDGIIMRGETQIDTSAVTGESMPRMVKVGDLIHSGCVNMTATVRMQAEKIMSESMASRILDSVENAAANKPQMDRFITRFSRVYTPSVMALAAATAMIPPAFFGVAWELSVYTALTFLVISCPCALVISVPLSFFAGIGAASKKKILFKSGIVMEALCRVRVAALDKTGTLTEGVFAFRGITSYVSDLGEEEILSLAAGGEMYSTHPVARSVVSEAERRNLPLKTFTEWTETAGEGIIGRCDGKQIYIGNERIMRRAGIVLPDTEETLSGVVIWVAETNRLLGKLSVRDALRSDAQESVARLRKEGILPVIMTGDTTENTAETAKEVGIALYKGDLLPEDKWREVDGLRREYGAVLFVGDGINDAPALAGADVGAAMGSGADSAIEASDLVFLQSSPTAVPLAIAIARATVKTAKRNVFFALAVKSMVLALGLWGYADMWVAIFADTGVTLLCILYSVQLLHRRFEAKYG